MVFLVPYAYDRMPGGKPREGVPANRLGSKARCDGLIQKALELSENIKEMWFVFVAGYSKEKPHEATPQVPVSIAKEMEQYVYEKSLLRTICRPWVWGTRQETSFAITVISSFMELNGISESFEIYVSTNLGHLPRVMLCWFFLKPKGWKVHFVVAKHSFTFWPEYFQETAKFFQYLYRFLFRKW